MCIWAHVCMCLPRPEEGVRSLELQLHVCKPPHMGARNPTLVLCKNSILSYLLSRVSNPSTLPWYVTQIFIFFDFSVVSDFLESSFMIFKIFCISYLCYHVCVSFAVCSLLHCSLNWVLCPTLSPLSPALTWSFLLFIMILKSVSPPSSYAMPLSCPLFLAIYWI